MILIKGMVRRSLQASDWRDLLIPIGAAMLSAGAQQLGDRAELQQARLDQLAAEVEFRREQLDGQRDVYADPEPVDPGDYGITDNPNSVMGPWKRLGIAAAVMAGAAVMLGVRQLWRRAMDDLQLEEQLMKQQRGYGQPGQDQGTPHPDPDPDEWVPPARPESDPELDPEPAEEAR